MSIDVLQKQMQDEIHPRFLIISEVAIRERNEGNNFQNYTVMSSKDLKQVSIYKIIVSHCYLRSCSRATTLEFFYQLHSVKKTRAALQDPE